MAAISWSLTSEFATAMNDEVQLYLNQMEGDSFQKTHTELPASAGKFAKGRTPSVMVS